jgi:hypothetical protein
MASLFLHHAFWERATQLLFLLQTGEKCQWVARRVCQSFAVLLFCVSPRRHLLLPLLASCVVPVVHTLYSSSLNERRVNLPHHDNQNLKMTTILCTRFPNLYPLRHDADQHIKPTTRSLAAFDASEESLYRAWAKLLKAYGGEDEVVMFHCNRGIAEVNDSEWDIQYVEYHGTRDILRSGDTGVFIGPVSSGT